MTHNTISKHARHPGMLGQLLTRTPERGTSGRKKGGGTHVVEVAHDRRVRRHGEGGRGVVLRLGAVKSGEHLRTTDLAFSNLTVRLTAARPRPRAPKRPRDPWASGPSAATQRRGDFPKTAPSSHVVAATGCPQYAVAHSCSSRRCAAPRSLTTPLRLPLPAVKPDSASPPPPPPRPPEGCP